VAIQKVIWTVLPKGFTSERELIVSLVPSFRLTPQAPDEQVLKAFRDLLDWPGLLAQCRFQLRVDVHAFDLKPISAPKTAVWQEVFPPSLPVAGYVFNDLSKHNLRSFPVRTVVSYLHTHYGELADQDGLNRPSLFGPDGSRLQSMLAEIGINRHSRFRGGIGRWFEDGRSKETGTTQLEAAINEAFFGDQGVAPPTVVGIDGEPRDNGSSYISTRKLRRALPASLSGAASGLFHSDAEYALYQANRFYQRPENEQPYSALPKAGAATAPIEAPKFDFHRMAASFADAPAVMRELGLVLDAIVVGSPALVDQAAGMAGRLMRGTMRLLPHHPALHLPTDESTPSTAFWLTPRRFTCDTRTDRHQAGLLRLGGARPIGTQAQELQGKDRGFALTAVDPDGAALKTVGFALSLQDHLSKVADPGDPETLKRPGELSYTTSQGETVAALRSQGITLVEHGRAGHVADDTIAASLKNDAVNTQLGNNIVWFAEDVLRGYRIDVFNEATGNWHSLCQRQSRYGWTAGHSTAPKLPDTDDEGYISGASTSSKPAAELPPGATQDHYLHEALVKWTGWSLVARRPGRRIRPFPDSSTPPADRAKLGLLQDEKVDEQTDADTHPDGTPVTRDVSAAPGSLPRLRFGTAYRMRARLVDLAGNGLLFGDDGLGKLEEASEPIAYLRYEPLDAPALSLRQRVSEGESLERMVIRSNFAQSCAAYLAGAPYASNDPHDSGFAYRAVNERHVVPPKTSQLLAEQHGAFETAIGAGATPAQIAATYDLITGLEAGTLYNGGAAVHIVTPPKDGAVPRSPERDLAMAPPEGFRLLPGEYLIHTEASLATPYLPDPIAAAVALRALPGVFVDTVIDASDDVRSVRIPGTEEYVVIVPLAGAWPERQGLRLALAEHPDELAGFDGCSVGSSLRDRLPTWNSAERVLTVYLRKGEVAPVRYASALEPATVNQLAIPRLASTPAKVAIQSVLGAHWMVTPDRPLTLVHATQQPVCEPVFEQLSPMRGQGQTWVEIRRSFVRFHARSTGQLEVLADWFEWTDDPGQPAPVRRALSARLPHVNIEQPPLRSQEPANGVLFEALGTGSDDAAHAHIRHEFGDHKFRLVNYRLRATSRFAEYLPASIRADAANMIRLGAVYAGHSLTLPPNYTAQYPDPTALPPAPLPPDPELGAPLLLNVLPAQAGSIVPASRRPDAPKIAYVVPTFRWVETGSDLVNGVISIRRGNGLRVYLERPWFSSGEGELLGVVCGSSTSGEQRFDQLPVHPELIGVVSQWGQDPIVDSLLPRAVMHANAFSARVAEFSFYLPEVARDMAVAAHRVHYDFERRLWFADIEIDAGSSYSPFVRLALVRVQPQALGNCRLSPVQHTQYAQLPTTRELHLSLSSQRRLPGVSLQVFGPAPEIGPASARGEFTGRFDVPAVISDFFGPLLGYDRGHNRIELVVQRQASGLATDLDWEDVSSIAPLSGEAQPGQFAPAGPRRGFEGLATEAEGAAKDATLAGATLGRVLATQIPSDIFLGGLESLHRLRNDLLFSGLLPLPPMPEAQRFRLMVREYERHFGDFNTTDHSPYGRTPRPGIVERLVFAREFYVLGYRPTT
jgi:hypothetical protein